MEKVLLVCCALALSTDQGEVFRQAVIKPAMDTARDVACTVYTPLLLTAVGMYALDRLMQKTVGKKIFFPSQLQSFFSRQQSAGVRGLKYPKNGGKNHE